MNDRTYLSLRDVADVMDIEPLRLIRLGRCLGMTSMERRVPRTVVQDVMRDTSPDERYRALVQVLVAIFGQNCADELDC